MTDIRPPAYTDIRLLRVGEGVQGASPVELTEWLDDELDYDFQHEHDIIYKPREDEAVQGDWTDPHGERSRKKPPNFGILIWFG